MAASGNSIALKSFQSFQVNDGLLAKVVEAVKSGEKEARTSGDVKSFEVFYKGFRQNIAIGRIYIVPSKVCNDRKNFPVSLLYGTVVRELNLGEEVADLITNKIGDTEFDEYSQADFTALKEKLFTEDGKETSLILYAPHWANIRDYIGFKYTSDDEKLTNLLRHLVFAAYFNPAVSSAFDALMTNVDTFKFDVTDITPKLTYPFLTENPLKMFPDLNKAANTKKKIFLTAKTADAITQEVLDPEELNVFEALDTALTDATQTESMEDVAEYKGPNGSNDGNAEIPQVDGDQLIAAKDDAGATTGLRSRPDYGEKDSFTAEMNNANSKGASTKVAFDRNATKCKDCGQDLDAFHICSNLDAKDVRMGYQYCGKGQPGSLYVAPLWGKNTASESTVAPAPFEVPFTNVGPGTSAHENADQSIAVKVDTISTKGEPPIGIAIDETGVARRPEEERKVAAAEKVAREIARDIDDGYVAMSSKMKAAVQKREDELNSRYAGRKKRAEVPLTEESIWDDIAMDFGEAPQVELPGEGSGSSEKALPEAVTSDKPEETKGHAEEPAKAEEKALENPESKSESKPEPAVSKEDTRPKSRLFGKDASGAKISLLYMNDYDIELAKRVLGQDPVLGPAVRFLEAFKEEVDSHSDGWAHWAPPVASAAKLMTLIQDGVKARREGNKHSVTVENLKVAMAPIKAFMTRRGLAAGMQMPKLAVKKRADVIQPDVAEAKSEVVNPDTVDADIKQPTESVEQAAKVAGVERTGDTKATEQYAGEHGCRTYVGKAPNGKVCMEPEVVVHDGRKYCEKHRPAESKKTGSDVSSDISEAKSELDGSKSELADNSEATATVNPDHFAAAGDENDETVEMELGFGDLADLASNLPHQDNHSVKTADAEQYIVKLVFEGTECYLQEEGTEVTPILEENLATHFDLEKANNLAAGLKTEAGVESTEVIPALPAPLQESQYDNPDHDPMNLKDTALGKQMLGSVSKTAEAYYTDRNYKTKKDLATAVSLGKQIGVYDPGQGMGGEAPPPQNGEVSVQGPHYPEPHRWYARVTITNGIITKVR